MLSETFLLPLIHNLYYLDLLGFQLEIEVVRGRYKEIVVIDFIISGIYR